MLDRYHRRMRLCFILGTRPEIIKSAPLIFAASEAGYAPVIIHSGQHYDTAMDGGFFQELSLPAADVRLSSGGKPYAEQVAYLLRELPGALKELRPDAVVLQGDTVTVMAGALAAHGLNIPIIHHEAGLRSRDQRMAEEYHRIIADHVSTLLCAPTEAAVANLLNEGIPRERVHLTGNAVVDAIRRFSGQAARESSVLEKLSLAAKSYFVLTFHRAENVDDPSRFSAFLASLERIVREHPDRRIVFPVHPRVEKRRAEFGQAWPSAVLPIGPLGYFDMLRLLSEADLVLTDSGGLQEEAAILGVPCVTLRDSTERPETVEAGSNVVAGLAEDAVSEAVRAMRGKALDPISAYGDGFASERIIHLARGAFGVPACRAVTEKHEDTRRQ